MLAFRIADLPYRTAASLRIEARKTGAR